MAKPNRFVSESAPIKSYTGEDRRVWVRFPCRLGSTCGPVPLPTAPNPETQWSAEILDLSAGGFRLSLIRRFEAGTPLIIEVRGSSEDSTHTATAQVVHVAPRPGGGWQMGCQFDSPLSEEELERLRALAEEKTCLPRPTDAAGEPRRSGALSFWAGSPDSQSS
jgi:hypothetical protein